MKALYPKCVRCLRWGAVGLAALWVSPGALAQGRLEATPPSIPDVVTPEVVTQQQRDIAALVTEFDYLIDHTQRLAQRYPQDSAPIRFNYSELLTQLRLTRNQTAAYLNEAHGAVLHAPPPPRRASLTERY